MLNRVQLMLDGEIKKELKRIAIQEDRSMSDVVREILKKDLKKKQASSKDMGTSFLLKLTKQAVSGPGDAEYDKYAYDK